MIQRSRVAFEPFPPHLDIQKEVENTPNFRFAQSIPCDYITKFPREALDLYIRTWVVQLGRPLVITGFDKLLDKKLFSEKWLMQNYANQSKHFLKETLSFCTSPWLEQALAAQSNEYFF